MKKKKYLLIILYLCVFSVMLTLNCLTPMVSDDFAHYYGMTGEHCTGIAQIVRDMGIFRQTMNGRILPHFFVYLFLTMPKIVFNVANAAMAVLLVFNLSRYVSGRIWAVLTLIFMLWIFIPDYGQVFLWLTGSINYLWGLVLFTVFIYPYYCIYVEKENSFSIVLMCILGFAVGCWSENGATAVLCACALFGVLIWIKNRKFPFKLFVPWLFCLAGFAVLMTAPATTSTRAGGDIMEHIWYIRVCLKDYCLWLFILYAAILALALITKSDRKTVLSTIVLIAAGLLSIAVFVFAVDLPARSFYVLVAFLVISCVMLLNEISFKKLNICFVLALAVLFAVRLYGGVQDILNMYVLSVERQTAAIQSDRDIELEAYIGKTKYVAIYDEELSKDSSNWYNDLVSKFYGFHSVTRKN